MTVAGAARAPRPRPGVGARDPGRHARDPRRAARRRRPGRDPARDLGRGGLTAREVPPLQAARRHRHPPPQRRVLRATASCTTAGSRCGGRSTSTTCSSRASGCSSRCRAARTRSRSGTSCATLGDPGRRALPRARHRRLQRRVGAVRARLRRRARPARSTRSTCATTTATTSRPRPRPPDGAPCGACGLSKRHLFNQVALDHGYDVVATGHNLDDEAAVLLGNVLQWEVGYLGRQYPVLPGRPGLRPQGEAAREAGRARDGRVLRAAGHRLPGRGVPDGRGQPPPRAQGDAEPARDAFARQPRPRSSTASGAAGTTRSRRPPTRSAPTCGPASSAARRPRRERCAFCSLRARTIAAGTEAPVELRASR